MTSESVKVGVTVERSISSADVDMFYGLYEEAFGPLRTLAAARHVLHPGEFREEMADPRILKYVAWADTGDAIGVSTITSDLSAVPWISPEYYSTKFPEHAARGAIYYLGFTLVRLEARHGSVFQDMVTAMLSRVLADRAVVGWDICAYNDDAFGFGKSIRKMLERQTDVLLKIVDRQSYYVADFGGQDLGGDGQQGGFDGGLD
jgi:hypothetical protein